MTKLLDTLGFSDNPFANYSAENEPAIDQYFVQPPYYEFIRERGLSGRSAVLFGARGAGKSATRLTFAKEAWLPQTSSRKRPLTVTFDDFSRVLSDGLDKVDLGRFVAEIGYLVTEVLLLWLATEPEDERKLILGGLTDAEETTLISLVHHFYMSRPDFVRQTSAQEPLKLLQQAWHRRAKLWFGDRWDSVSVLLASLAQSIGSKWIGSSAAIESGLTTLLKAGHKQWNEAHFARAILGRLVETVRIFGFSGIIVLVDKVDETTHTNNSTSASARLLYPILANTQLLEIENFGWLFFLWDKLHDEYTGNQYPVRLDKIANTTISWDEKFLSELINRRLSHFSGGKTLDFASLCTPELSHETSFSEAVRMSMRSPRELIRILDTIIREHDEEFAHQPDAPLLIQTSIDRSLDKYATESAQRTFKKIHLQQLSRLTTASFINKDVQQTFRINDQSARNRIRGWIDAGIVSQTGTRQAEGGAGGKPSHEYSITDFRVARLLSRGLLPDWEFDSDANSESNEGDAT